MHVYDMTVPQFVRVLGQVARWLDKAEAYAAQKKFDVNNLLTARLAPDQFPLTRQIQSTCDQAKLNTARLTGLTAPAFEDNEKTVAELRERIQKTIAWLETVKPENFEGTEERAVRVGWMPGKAIKGADILVGGALPNFYFHASMAYAILRHNGVDLGKADFLGTLPFFDA